MRTPKNLLVQAEMRLVKNDLEAKFGRPVTMCQIIDREIRWPNGFTYRPDSAAILRVFELEGFEGIEFFACGIQEEGSYAVCLFTDEGFQVWPPEPGQCCEADTRALMEEALVGAVITPFAARLIQLGYPKLMEWLDKRREGQRG